MITSQLQSLERDSEGLDKALASESASSPASLMLKLFGAGKVHGSLARAGKVRKARTRLLISFILQSIHTTPKLDSNFFKGFVHLKVRGQTPKVAKQDKKKTPKGRAKKRILYNRRFVNVGEHSGLYIGNKTLADECFCLL